MEWDAVTWSLADQVAERMKLSDKAAALLTDDMRPDEFFDALRGAGALDDALSFLALALPRRIAIAWGRDCAAHTSRQARLRQGDIIAASAVSSWLADPSDEQRWIAHDAATNAGLDSAEAMLAMAVFASGGSLSPAGTPQPVPPPPDLAGRLVGGAVLMAAVRVAPQQIAGTKAAFLDRGGAHAAGNLS